MVLGEAADSVMAASEVEPVATPHLFTRIALGDDGAVVTAVWL